MGSMPNVTVRTSGFRAVVNRLRATGVQLQSLAWIKFPFYVLKLLYVFLAKAEAEKKVLTLRMWVLFVCSFLKKTRKVG